jgi:hypothetical protein
MVCAYTFTLLVSVPLSKSREGSEFFSPFATFSCFSFPWHLPIFGYSWCCEYVHPLSPSKCASSFHHWIDTCLHERVPESHHITRMEARQEPLFFSGVVLFPGDSLPLRVLQPRFQGAVRRAMRQTTHACTIGVVIARNALLQFHFGCTIESSPFGNVRST